MSDCLLPLPGSPVPTWSPEAYSFSWPQQLHLCTALIDNISLAAAKDNKVVGLSAFHAYLMMTRQNNLVRGQGTRVYAETLGGDYSFKIANKANTHNNCIGAAEESSGMVAI